MSTRHQPKRQKSTADQDLPKRNFDGKIISGAGLKLNQHGVEFQLLLLSQCLWRVMKEKINDFLLATELPEAEKFDDVVVQYQHDYQSIVRFLQAKHKESARDDDLPQINLKDLLSSDETKEYSLLKYFRSFVKVEEKCSCISTIPVFFIGSSILDFTLLTNIDLDNNLAGDCFEVDSQNRLEDDVLLKIGSNKVEKYKIKSSDNDLTKGLEPLLLTTSDFDELVAFVADCLLSGKQLDGNSQILKEYYHPLVRYIMDFERDPKGGRRYYGKLKKEFTTTCNHNEEVMDFRNALVHEVAFRNSNFNFKISKSDANKNKHQAMNSRKRKASLSDSPLSRMLDEIVENFGKSLSIPAYFDTDDPLLTEVLDFKKRQFTNSFIKGGNELTPVAKMLRKKVVAKLIGNKVAEQRFQKESKNEFPCTEGVATQFKLHEVPPIDSPYTLAKEMAKFIESCQSRERKLDINDTNASDELREKMDQLAGHVMVKVGKAYAFSGRFIRGQFLPQHVKDFRLSLKKLLGIELFSRIDEFSLINLKGFKSCEESYLHKSLPKPTTNESIESFYEHFRIIVKYPNRNEIRLHLENEVQTQHNNLNGKAFVDSFVQNMWQWMTSRAGTFYTPRKAKLLLQQLDENLSCYELDGISQSFFLGLPNRYRFDCHRWRSELEEFLQTSKSGLLLLSVPNSTIARIRCMQAFNEMKDTHLTNGKFEFYLRQFGYLFTDFDVFVDDTFRNKIAKRNKDSNKWGLWIVGCNNVATIEQLSSLLELCFDSSLESTVHRKVTFIVNDKKFDAFRTTLTKSLQQGTYDIEVLTRCLPTTFNDLHDESQRLLLDKARLQLQKREFKLGDIVNNNTANLIDEDTLDRLISVRPEAHVICIGNEKQYFESIFDTDCYIERHICSIVIDKDATGLTSSDEENVYYLKSHNLSKDVIILADNRDEFNEVKNRITVEESAACPSVHWLQRIENQWIWRDTIGSISNLTRYRKRDTVLSTWNEAEFLTLKADSKIIIIYGIPGAGKSVLLSILFQRSFVENAVWKLYINLNMYSDFFSQKLKERTDWSGSYDGECGEFLLELLQSNEHSKLISTFEINLLKSAFINGVNGLMRLGLFFDGFDEISPNYKEVVLTFLRALKQCPCVNQIFITTRPNFCQFLEEGIETFGHEIGDLSPKEQVELLAKLLEKKNIPIVMTELQALIKELTKTLPGKQRFTAIPLHIHMLAEVCTRMNHEEIKSWFRNFDPSTLYEMYFEMKHRIFREEKMQLNPTNVSGMEDCRYAYNDFLKRHEKLALWSMYSKDDIAKIVRSMEDFEEEVHELLEDIKAGKYKYGIVFTVVNDSPLFTHRTYAEFLVAHYFVRQTASTSKLTTKTVNFIVSQMIGRIIYPPRIFFDSLMAKKRWTWKDLQKFEDIDCLSIRQALIQAYDNNHWGIFNFVWEFLRNEGFYHGHNICMETLEECTRDRSYFALFAFINSCYRKIVLINTYGRSILNAFALNRVVCWEGGDSPTSTFISYFCTLGSGEWIVKNIPRWLAEHNNFSISFQVPKNGFFLRGALNWNWPDPDIKVKERTLADEWQPINM